HRRPGWKLGWLLGRQARVRRTATPARRGELGRSDPPLFPAGVAANGPRDSRIPVRALRGARRTLRRDDAGGGSPGRSAAVAQDTRRARPAVRAAPEPQR